VLAEFRNPDAISKVYETTIHDLSQALGYPGVVEYNSDCMARPMQVLDRVYELEE
jgi:hypothetical protein